MNDKKTPIQNRAIRKRCEEEQRVDLLIQTLCEKSRSEIRGMFQQRCVKVNGEPCSDPGLRVKPGDVVQVEYDPKRKYRERAERYSSRLFRPLFEDNYIIVVEKSAGFLTVPSETEDQSLLAAVNKYISVKSGRPQGATLVHRLDRDTSGVLLLAKHPNLARSLKDQFASRKPYRKYFAITKFGPRASRGTYQSYLATDEDLNQYSTDEKHGKLAITHYKVVKRYTDCTFLHVELETGRRNQIRVHFADHGHPVLGDVRYRPGMAMHPRWTHNRLALHAAELHFVHPVTKKRLEFSTPMPEEMAEFLKGSTVRTVEPRVRTKTPPQKPREQANRARGGRKQFAKKSPGRQEAKQTERESSGAGRSQRPKSTRKR